MADSQGAQSALYIEPAAAPHTFNTSSERYEFLSENIQRIDTIIDTDGIRGTRSHQSERTRAGQYTIGGSFTFNPSPIDLDLWFPRILGAAESTDTFALAETLPAFGMLVDRVTSEMQYTDCQVNRAIFRGSGNDLVSLEIEIVGVTEVEDTTPPVVALTTAANDAPYHFIDSDNAGTSRLAIFGATPRMLSFEIEINNFLLARFGNSQTATSVTPQDRLVRMAVELPYDTANEAIYRGTDAAGSLVLTNGGMSTTFTFGFLEVASESPVIAGKSPINLNLEMIARKLTTTEALVVTHDSVA